MYLPYKPYLYQVWENKKSSEGLVGQFVLKMLGNSVYRFSRFQSIGLPTIGCARKAGSGSGSGISGNDFLQLFKDSGMVERVNHCWVREIV